MLHAFPVTAYMYFSIHDLKILNEANILSTVLWQRAPGNKHGKQGALFRSGYESLNSITRLFHIVLMCAILLFYMDIYICLHLLS